MNTKDNNLGNPSHEVQTLARAVVFDTEAGTILDCVTLDEEESNPGRFVEFPVADQVPAILGQSLAWILE